MVSRSPRVYLSYCPWGDWVNDPKDSRNHEAQAIAHAEASPVGEPLPPCPICNRQKPLVYDHDHLTGRFRGFVCGNCNSAMGHAGDDPARLEAMAAYLRRDRP
jgi:hypothetical protein